MTSALNTIAAACQRTFSGRTLTDGDITQPFGSMMRGYDGSFYGFGSTGSWIGLIGHGLFSLVLLGIGIALIVWLVRLAKRSNTAHNQSSGYGDHSETESALKLLNERYVKGEITEEDYQKIKKNLKD